MQLPSLENKKKFIAWFLKEYTLPRRESLWILNYLLNHEILLKNVHFVQEVEKTPRGMMFSIDAKPTESFYYYKQSACFDNPEQAFHDLRLNWKEDCYVEFKFENAYQMLVSFGVFEENPFASSVEEENVELENAIQSIQLESYKYYLIHQINQALEEENPIAFEKYSQKLQDVEKALLGQDKEVSN